MKKVFKYFKKYRFHIIISLVLIVLVALVSSYQPIVEMQIIEIIDKYVKTSNADLTAYIAEVLVVVFTLIAMYLFVAASRLTFNFLITSSVQNSMKAIRSDVQKKIHKMPIRYFDNTPIGDIMSRMNNDVESFGNGLQQAFAAIISSVLSVIFILTFIIWKLTWHFAVLAVIMAVIIFILSRIILKYSGPLYQKRFKTFGILSGHLQEQYTGYKEITLYNKQQDAVDMFDGIMVDLTDSIFKSDFVSGLLNPLVMSVTYLTIVAVALIGGNLVIAGNAITIAMLHAGIRYTWRLGNPITQITQMSVMVQSSLAAGRRVFDFLGEDEELPDVDNPEHIESLKGHVVFENVNFSYVKDKPILKNISFEAKPGELIAIVGPTGSGKTTIINLLMRFYDINSGKILLDGVNINNLTKDELRTHFGMVLQDTWLFNGSIEDNIKYGNDNATLEDVINAAKLAKIDHYINTLPNGYNMFINEEADNISQGEKQLMTIARAFLANPQILILDEATSTVDTRLELMLQDAMKNIIAGRTSFVIAHRLSTIRNADKIIVLKDGEIIEVGNHDELIAKKGFYEDLYNSQFEGQDE